MAELFDVVVRHQIYLEGLKRGRNADFPKVLAQLDRALRTGLAHIDYASLSEASKRKLNDLLVALRKSMRAIFDPWLKLLVEWLERFMQVEVEAFNAYFGGNIEPASVLASSKTEPMSDGLFWLPLLRGSAAYSMMKIERLVIAGYANQTPTDEIIRGLLGTKAKSFKDGIGRTLDNQTTAAVATVMQHLSAQASMNVAKSIFGEYEWLSVLDDVTTRICRDRDGKRYVYGRGPMPPAHMRCRSTTMPVPPGAGPTPDIGFAMWASRQSSDFINDAFDGQAPKRYEGSAALTLDQYTAKRAFILS
jgi:SPP1 gp7 family putative phage head morphogenesis protein